MKDPGGVGTIHKDIWQKNIDILVQLGLLKTPPKVEVGNGAIAPKVAIHRGQRS